MENKIYLGDSVYAEYVGYRMEVQMERTVNTLELAAIQEFERTSAFVESSSFDHTLGLYINAHGRIDMSLQRDWMLFWHAWIKSRNHTMIEMAEKRNEEDVD
jgi:hypothetical protein